MWVVFWSSAPAAVAETVLRFRLSVDFDHLGHLPACVIGRVRRPEDVLSASGAQPEASAAPW